MNAFVFQVTIHLVSYRLGVRACVVLAPLLGVTWLIGFLVPLHIAFSYIFVILNSTQVKSSKTLRVCSSIWLLICRYKNVRITWKASGILKSVSISKNNSDLLSHTRSVTLVKKPTGDYLNLPFALAFSSSKP